VHTQLDVRQHGVAFTPAAFAVVDLVVGLW
jgi:hypothetical protein